MIRIAVSAMWLCSGSTSKNSGLSRYAQQLVSALADRGDALLTVFCPADYDPPANLATHELVQFTKVKARGRVSRLGFEHHQIAGLVANHDVLLSASPALPIRCQMPMLAMVHDLIPLHYPQGHRKATVSYTRWNLGNACRVASRLLSNSQATKDDLVSTFHVDPDRISVTPLGPGNTTPPVQAEPVQPPYILCLGNLEPRKNLPMLVRAFGTLQKTHPNLTLKLVGAPRDEAKDAAPTGNGIEWLGYVADEQLPKLFAEASVFAFPSLHEGFGLPVLEAMRFGAPVAASNIPAVTEVGGEAIATFDPNDAASAVHVIGGLLCDREAANRLRKSGFERAKAMTWEHTADLTMHAVREVLGR